MMLDAMPLNMPDRFILKNCAGSREVSRIFCVRRMDHV